VTLLVEECGPLLLVQDLGRSGHAHLGVPPSGALDPAALTLANRLVGNPQTAAGLEILTGGVKLQARRSLRIALCGGLLGLRIAGRAGAWGTASSIRTGEYVEVVPGAGLRAWLAVGGGIDVPMTLGSRSTDTLSGLGPPAVRAGDELRTGTPPLADPAGEAIPAPTPDVVTLDVVLGPRDSWFTLQALDVFFGTEYTVSPSSNRTALRLDNDVPLDRRLEGELPSEGVVTGAVQVPTNGRPLIFLADHPVTGGYPVIAVIEPAGLAACAQARPGDRVRFRRSRPGRSR
jgi:biotin-dependent carboxylase-like uncharacterized protein